LIFGLVAQIAGGSRLSILAVIAFFVVGGSLLLLVDEQEGIRVARAENAAVAEEAYA